MSGGRPGSRLRRGGARPVVAALAVLVLAAGCMTSGDIVTDRPWKLVQVAGSTPVGPQGVAGVGFGADGRFTLDTGCNSGGGSYHFEGNRIAIDDVRLTAVGCDGAVGTQDRTMTKAIEAGPTWSVDTGTGRLRLTAPDGTVLLFETS